MSSCLIKDGSKLSEAKGSRNPCNLLKGVPQKLLKRFSQRNKASAVRQFPNSCGRDVTSVLKENSSLQFGEDAQCENEKCQASNETIDEGFTSQVSQIADISHTLDDGRRPESGTMKSEVMDHDTSNETVEHSRACNNPTSLNLSNKASSATTSVDHHCSITPKTAKSFKIRISVNRTFPVGCGRPKNTASDQQVEPVDLSETCEDCATMNAETETTKSPPIREEIEVGATSEEMKTEEQVKEDSLFSEKVREFLKLIMDDHNSILLMDIENGTDSRQAENNVKARRKKEEQFQIAPLKKSKLEFMPSNRDAILSPGTKESFSSGSKESKMDEHDAINVTNLKQAENNVKAKRKKEEQFQIAPLKKSKLEIMLSNKDATSSPGSKESFSSGSKESKMDEHDAINVTNLKQAENKVRPKRKKEGQFQIAPLKKSKRGSILSNKDATISTVSNESKDPMTGCDEHKESIARNKIMHNLSIYRAIHAEMLQKDPSHASMVAFNVYKDKTKGCNSSEKLIGSVPGVKIGDMFHLRAEMYIAGIHCHLQAGIDYIKQNGREIAVSIVSSGRDSNSQKDPDLLLYSGSGVSKEDQKLLNGNLALKNSMDAQIPVRVIHGVQKAPRRRHTKFYVYDGLYLVENHWVEKGNKGNSVLMFCLRRIAGQPRIAEPCTVCLEDISNGEESTPIHLVNTIDRDQPTRFTYITKVMEPLFHRLSSPVGCDCVDGCSDSQTCACAAKNGGKLPFNDAGAIVKAKPLVYECGPSCMCPCSCMNRVSQHGVKFQLEVFKTESRGWGVRSSDFIPSGSFICEYVGEILEDEDAQKRNNDEYLFSIGNNYHDKNLWKGLSKSIPSLQKDASGEMTGVGFAVDGLKYGNVGRFINHSCTPNLYAQNLLYDHDDIRMPHIMFFASEDIRPWEELTYDYNYPIDQVHDSDGYLKKKKCFCGSAECTGWLY